MLKITLRYEISSLVKSMFMSLESEMIRSGSVEKVQAAVYVLLSA